MNTETSDGALTGKLIIDLSRVLGSPYCTQMPGDHGAEIIKIEPPRGDETRDWGQYLDMTLYDCAVSLMHPHIPNYMYSGQIPVATGNAHPNISPYDTFRTKTVDIFTAAGNNRAYAKMCAELGREELITDARFINNSE